jgi:hypothetical protein
MNCPPDIAHVLTDILRVGLLRIRALAWSGDIEGCAREADHLHNLPGLLTDYSPDLLHYYLNVERPAFIRHSQESDPALTPLWQRLESLAAGNPVP